MRGIRPDISSQSNIDAGYAAQLWQEYMNPLKNEGYTLLSPATATGTKWMTQFNDACNGACKVSIFLLLTVASSTLIHSPLV